MALVVARVGTLLLRRYDGYIGVVFFPSGAFLLRLEISPSRYEGAFTSDGKSYPACLGGIPARVALQNSPALTKDTMGNPLRDVFDSQ